MKNSMIFIFFMSLITSAFSMENRELEQGEDQRPSLEKSLINNDYFIIHDQKTSDRVALEEFNFDYKSSYNKSEYSCSFIVGNIFNAKTKWGMIALYPHDVDQSAIKYSYGDFSDIERDAAWFLSTLAYEYIAATDLCPAHIIVEKVSTSIDAEGVKLERKGYSQACLKYFLDEFVVKHTEVTQVFSDLRNPICRVFFPKYGFERGVSSDFKDVVFKRALQQPYYWLKK